MEDRQQRIQILLGGDKMKRLQQAYVLMVGLGGVGAYAAKMICRTGVGRMTIADADAVQLTDINGRLPTLHSTIGKEKSVVLTAHFKDISPDIQLRVLPVFLKDGNIPELLDTAQYDFAVDAIDTLAPRYHLIVEILKHYTKIVSNIGTGAKSNITQVRFADIWDTYHCRLSKAMRERLQRSRIKRRSPVMFSTEQTGLKAVLLMEDKQNKKSACGTMSYMPAIFGYYLMKCVVKRL